MTSAEIIAVLSSALAIGIVIYWYTMGGEKGKESKTSVAATEIKYPMAQGSAFVEEKPVSSNQGITDQPTASAPIEDPLHAVASENIKIDAEYIQPETSRVIVKVEPITGKESEPAKVPENVQEIAKAPEAKDENITSGVRAKSTGRRRTGGTRRKKAARQETKAPL